MDWAATIAGCLLIVWGALEVLISVLYPRPISGPLAAALSHLSQRITATLWRSSTLRTAISLVGPFLVAAQILSWGALLWLGFSLIVWPQMGESIIASGDRATPTDFLSAMYVTGFSLTTLGVGDLVPSSAPMQLLIVVQAAVGFSFFTLVLTYIMSVYSALAARNRLALSIDSRTRRTGDPYIYLHSTLKMPEDSVVRGQDELAEGMLVTVESHQFYPVLHYFRFPEPEYALPRMLYFCLEVATVAEVVRAAEAEGTPTRFEPTGRLWCASNKLLSRIVRNFARHGKQEPKLTGQHASLKQFLDALQSVRGKTFADGTDPASRYEELRHRWLGDLQAVARSQGVEELLESMIQESEKGSDPFLSS